jgi:hypothetical protein
MSKKSNYRVLRDHDGDRFYREGDTRTAVAGEVAHLLPNTLELIGPAADEEPEVKAEPEPDNKAPLAAPASKETLSVKPKGK